MGEFRAGDDGAVVGGRAVWGILASYVKSRLAKESWPNGGYTSVLTDFIDAAAEAANRPVGTGVSLTKPAESPARMIEITPVEAARRIGCSPQYVRRLALEGRVKARRVGRLWLIDELEIDRQDPRRSA